MNRWTPPPACTARAPGRRSRWNALTINPSTPTRSRSSLETARTPARVASGRKVGTARVPRLVIRGSGTDTAFRGSQPHDEHQLVGDRGIADLAVTRPEPGDQPVDPAAVGPFHPTAPSAERADREADNDVVHGKTFDEPKSGIRLLAVEDRDELEEEGNVGRRGVEWCRQVADLGNVLLAHDREEALDERDGRRVCVDRDVLAGRWQPHPGQGERCQAAPQVEQAGRRSPQRIPDAGIEPVQVGKALTGRGVMRHEVPAHGPQRATGGVVAASCDEALKIASLPRPPARAVCADGLMQPPLDALDRIVRASRARQLLVCQPAHDPRIDSAVASGVRYSPGDGRRPVPSLVFAHPSARRRYAISYARRLGRPRTEVSMAATARGGAPSRSRTAAARSAVSSPASDADSGTPADSAARTSRYPGSLIRGIPASLTSATAAPSWSRARSSGVRALSLCSCREIALERSPWTRARVVKWRVSSAATTSA